MGGHGPAAKRFGGGGGGTAPRKALGNITNSTPAKSFGPTPAKAKASGGPTPRRALGDITNKRSSGDIAASSKKADAEVPVPVAPEDPGLRARSRQLAGEALTPEEIDALAELFARDGDVEEMAGKTWEEQEDDRSEARERDYQGLQLLLSGAILPPALKEQLYSSKMVRPASFRGRQSPPRPPSPACSKAFPSYHAAAAPRLPADSLLLTPPWLITSTCPLPKSTRTWRSKLKARESWRYQTPPPARSTISVRTRVAPSQSLAPSHQPLPAPAPSAHRLQVTQSFYPNGFPAQTHV